MHQSKHTEQKKNYKSVII